MTINSKSVTPNPARVGVESTYIISVRNDGANPAEDVVVTDVIDPNRYLIVGSATTTKPGGTCSVNAGSGTVTCALGTFNRTEVRQVRVNVMPLFPFGGNDLSNLPVQHVNQATVTTSTRDANGGNDPQAGNNFFNLDHTVNAPTFDLAVSKQESNPATDDPVRFDETLNYDIRVSNFGPSRATDVLVTDIPAPPPGLTMTLSSVTINPVAANGGLVLQAAPNAGCSPSGGNVVCRIDTTNVANNVLNAGSQVIFRVSFTMGGAPPAGIVTFANGVEVTSAEQPTATGPGADIQTANNSATQNTTVLPSTDLEIVSKSRSGALERSVNEPIEFVIRFRNNGPSTASAVRITDALPSGFIYSATPAPSTSIPGGSASIVSDVACSGTGTITCDVTGTFPAGTANTVDLSVFARAQAPYAGPIAPIDATDTATIEPGVDEFGDPLSEDANNTNDSQSAVVQIRASSLAGSVFADDNVTETFEAGEGMAGVLLTLSGTDAFGNAVSFTTTTDTNGAFSFDNLPPSDSSGYTLVETQVSTHYDRSETAGTLGGTVDNATFSDDPAQNTISGIVLPPSTDGTGYLFQNRTNAVILAEDDTVATVNSSDGQDDAINAFDNDRLNGNPFSPSEVVATIITPASNAGVTLDPVTGLVDVAPGTPAGTYTINYQICDAEDPTNCMTATVTVEVVAPAINAVDDSVTGINGLTGQNDVLNVLSDDTLNGVAADIGDVTITVATGSSVPAGLTFDPATGSISVDPGTAAGDYSFDYTVCENLNPANCSTATATVTVTAASINAVDDSVTGINGFTGQNDVLNVLGDDTLNGAAANIGDVTITVATGSSVPAGLTFDPASGNISVDPGTAAGDYSFDYTICEDLNPANCSTATATVTVVAASINAVDDSVTGINGLTGQANVLNALADDTLNGLAVTTGEVTISLAPGATVPAGLTFDPATGNVSVEPNTPAGSYSFDYQICEILNRSNCAIATETVTVVGAPIAAVNDSASGINGTDGADDVLNVLTGDTLNGSPVTIGEVTISLAPGATVPAGLTFDPATGNVSVDPGTAAGDYSFDYQICEILNPTNCTTATATVTVDAAPIDAQPELADPVNGGTGATGVIDVLPNDTLNNDPVDLSIIDISVVTPATPLGSAPVPVLNPATGLVDVPAGTPAGDYVVEYQICERLNPTNCATTTVTVPVIAGPIEAVDDSVADINGAEGADNVLNVLTGDTLNGSPVTADTVAITVAPGSSVPAGLSFDPATGNVSVDPGTPAGDYSFDYQICEILNPTNCTIATATVTVIPSPIEAVDDSATEIDSVSGLENAVNVFDGDTINGNPAGPDNAILSVAPGSSLPPGILFDPTTGEVSVAPKTPEGTYSFDYQLCEALNPDNCTTATVTLTVVPSLSAVSGIVYLDENLNRTFESDEDLQIGWTVQLVLDDEVVATTQTDADGFYSIEDLAAGDGYEIRFLSPITNVLFGVIEADALPAGGSLADQNLPIDPSGVVYDAITRQPVRGAIVNLVDANGNPLPDVCFIDPSQSGQITGTDGYYRFDIVAGADAACPAGRTQYDIAITAPNGYSNPVSTIIAAEVGSLNVAGLSDPAAIVPSANAPQLGQPTTYYLSLLIGEGDANVVNNHIPLDPFTSRNPLLVTKTSTVRTANVGDLVPYTISVNNTEGADRVSVDVVDILPPGFRFVPGSGRVNDTAIEPVVSNRELRWEDQFLPGNTTTVYSIIAVIGAGVTDGDRINTAVARNGNTNAEISNRGQAVVSIVPSAIFDCAEIIGKVYDDFNGNGYQDDGEPGVPSARLATVNGDLVTTDEFGRYHITCAAVPNAQIGSNFVLKLDPRSIPAGYQSTTDNPQSIRLTRGKISELNFGIQRHRVIAIAIDAHAFVPGTAQLKADHREKLAGLALLDEQRLMIQVSYKRSDGESEAGVLSRLATAREKLLEAFRLDDWTGPEPTIETSMVRVASPAAGGE